MWGEGCRRAIEVFGTDDVCPGAGPVVGVVSAGLLEPFSAIAGGAASNECELRKYKAISKRIEAG